MTSFPRESWQDPANPVTGPKPKAKRTVGVIHYSASSSIPVDKPAWLRSMQADYTRNRGYSLGYGYMVAGNGDDYEIRGNDFNMASNNGDKVDGNANDWTLSILLDVSTTSPATPAAIATCRRILDQAGIFTRPVPHSFYDYTSCCGDIVTAQINAGLFDQISQPDPLPPDPEPEPEPEDDMPKLYLVRDPRDGAFFVTDTATFKTHVSAQEIADDGVRVFGWIEQPQGGPWELNPTWGPYLDLLPQTGVT